MERQPAGVEPHTHTLPFPHHSCQVFPLPGSPLPTKPGPAHTRCPPVQGGGALSFPQAWDMGERLTQQPGQSCRAVLLCVSSREDTGRRVATTTCHPILAPYYSPISSRQGTGSNTAAERLVWLLPSLLHPPPVTWGQGDGLRGYLPGSSPGVQVVCKCL